MPPGKYLKPRSGTSTLWASTNPILQQGEIGAETDTGNFKIGDGATAWNSLGYAVTTAGPIQTNILPSLGDGSDNSLSSGFGTITFTRDMYYANITFGPTDELNLGGFKLFWTGVCDISEAKTGAITVSGLNGNNANQLDGGAIPAAPVVGSVGAGVRGVAGTTGTVSAATNGTNATASPAIANGGASNGAGNGGAGLAGSAGNGGTGTTPTANFFVRRYAHTLVQGITQISGGMGGASGAPGVGDGHYQGGGSGGGANGAGILPMYGNVLYRGSNTNAGIIQANGGNGGNGSVYSTENSVSGGGGAGSAGGGGYVLLFVNVLAGYSITNGIAANGGNGGNGGPGQNMTLQILTRESTPGGTSWSDVDQFLETGTDSTVGYSVGNRADNLGYVYMAGTYRTSANVTHWIVRQSTNNGSTWTTVDDYNLAAGKNAIPSVCWVDASGNIYAAGEAISGSDTYWVVRQSTNNGSSWTTVDQFLYTGGVISVAEGMGEDTSGNIYVIGQGLVGGGTYHWVVRQAAISSITSWTTIQDYLPGGGVATGLTIAVDSLGNVYSAGVSVVGTPTSWVTQQTTVSAIAAALPGMPTWTITDTFEYAGGNYSQPNAIAVDLLGNVYVVGEGNDGTGQYHWIVRQTTNQGGSWSTVDDYTDSNGLYGLDIAVDASGNIYAIGEGVFSGIYNWITRKSSDNGVSWNNVDQYVFPSGFNTTPSGIGIDALDNLYVTGTIVTPNPTIVGLGAYGGYGGNSGYIYIYENYTATATLTSGTSGSAGNANSGATGGTGGAGGICEANL